MALVSWVAKEEIDAAEEFRVADEIAGSALWVAMLSLIVICVQCLAARRAIERPFTAWLREAVLRPLRGA